jgi:outer membrane protein insertion porin family
VKRLAIPILIFLFASPVLFAQQQQTIKINRLRVEGNVLSDPTTIRLNSGLSEGATVVMEDIQQALRNLWALKLFSDIEIIIEQQSLSGIDLLIRVAEHPRLNKVLIRGNDALSTEDINEIIVFYRGMVISPGRLYRAERQLLARYKSEGYQLAKVNIDTSMTSNGRVNVNLDIEEGP